MEYERRHASRGGVILIAVVTEDETDGTYCAAVRGTFGRRDFAIAGTTWGHKGLAEAQCAADAELSNRLGHVCTPFCGQWRIQTY